MKNNTRCRVVCVSRNISGVSEEPAFSYMLEYAKEGAGLERRKE
jgi:hypothetical protein